MKISKKLINTLIPFLFIIPMFSMISCTAQEASDTADYTLNYVGDHVADLPENFREAAPMLQEDLENIWGEVTGTVTSAANEIGISEPPHPLADTQESEVRISGSTFNEVISNASAQLTRQDLENMPTEDLASLNNILPFDVNPAEIGESLAEILNHVDFDQIAALFSTEAGAELVRLLNSNGGTVQLGHVTFEINPAPESQAYDLVATSDTGNEVPVEETDAYQEALIQLANFIQSQQ